MENSANTHYVKFSIPTKKKKGMLRLRGRWSVLAVTAEAKNQILVLHTPYGFQECSCSEIGDINLRYVGKRRHREREKKEILCEMQSLLAFLELTSAPQCEGQRERKRITTKGYISTKCFIISRCTSALTAIHASSLLSTLLFSLSVYREGK